MTASDRAQAAESVEPRWAAPQAGYRPIGDYAVIGDAHTAALVSKTGSIDWWCPGRFDGPAVFCAVLDDAKGGRFRIAPSDECSVERRYRGDSLVLETTFTTAAGGVARLSDFMPVTAEPATLPSFGSVMRSLECFKGRVRFDVWYEPRFEYGRIAARIRERSIQTFVCTHGADALALRTDVPLQLTREGTALSGRLTLESGDRCTFGLAFARGSPLVYPPVGDELARLAGRTAEWWQQWSDQLRYEGDYRAAVTRSALVLKMLIYAPSGAMVAAPTTSLPEEIGGRRNWDYRYCWLRDAGLSTRALMRLGCLDEARSYLAWLTHATNLTWPRLRVLYDVFGGSRADERELEHLEGYMASRPVQAGNGAADQLQLDVYGEVVLAAYEYATQGGELDRRTAKRLTELGKIICRVWQEADSGLWEIRSGPYHHVHSKVMCWVALDRLLKLHERGIIDGPVERFRAARESIREAVEGSGFDAELRSYTQSFERKVPDASLLLLSSQGYIGPGDARMRSTFDFLEAGLSYNGLWYRYPAGTNDGLPGSEGAFGASTFWAAEYLARRGDREAAIEQFERALSCANDLFLFPEEFDPDTGAALGNIPQAFTHVGLINAALAIADATPNPR